MLKTVKSGGALFSRQTMTNTYIHIWLVVSTPLKNMLVSWDDEIPNTNGNIKFMFQTTNQYILHKTFGLHRCQ